MRELMLSIVTVVIAAAAIVALSRGVIVPTQANPGMSINPTDMMMTYRGRLPLEQWDPI